MNGFIRAIVPGVFALLTISCLDSALPYVSHVGGYTKDIPPEGIADYAKLPILARSKPSAEKLAVSLKDLWSTQDFPFLIAEQDTE